MFRIGEGYDVHKFEENRNLILGGVKIPYEKGLLGHSDADVLVHAIMDAMFGAIALGDIGKHFPDTDDKYKNISSLLLLKQTAKIISETIDDNFEECLCNIDATIICQAPKLRDYIDEMRKNIAETLNVNINKISVKATTEEGLGFTGAKLGIAVKVVCLINVKE